ncbi:MAG: helix-turn-helix domain-containing protein [Ruminococcaceae bacterium]|nr:helix-turn-helix domain-containing protein [Oscillospiraceae bacterium]
MEEKQTLGKRIAALRKQSGMTQKELGERLYVSDKTVSRWERDESAPELALIPLLASLFGITSDELLGGMSVHESDEACSRDNRSAEAFDGRARRTEYPPYRLTRFRNLSGIALGLPFFGIIGAAIANLGFLRAIVGFFTGLVFLVAAIICQLCFANSFLPRAGKKRELTAEEKQDVGTITRTTLRVFTVIIGSLGFLFPLLTVEDAHWGLTAETWLYAGLLCAGTALAIWGLFYAFFLRSRLVQCGNMPADERQRRLYRAQKRLLALLLVVGAVWGGLMLAVHSFVSSLWWRDLAEPQVFSTYEAYLDFAEVYAEKTIFQLGNHVYQDSVTQLPNGEQAKPEKISYGEILGENGEVLLRFPLNRRVEYQIIYAAETPQAAPVFYGLGSSVSCRIELSEQEDCLPIRVWSAEDKYRGLERQEHFLFLQQFITILGFAVIAGIGLARYRALRRQF